MLAHTLRYLGYVSSKSDPDVQIKSKTKSDVTEYYAYLLVYVDDVLHLHHDTDIFMNRLSEVHRLKDDSVVEPYRYLGANIDKV